MEYFNSYLFLIVVTKILYVFMELIHIYLKMKGESNSDLDKKIVYWKIRVQFIFKFLISILIIYLFNPTKTSVVISGETKLILYLFGFVLLITADWDTFFHDSIWFRTLQKIVGTSK
jgi:hypothetical protein